MRALALASIVCSASVYAQVSAEYAVVARVIPPAAIGLFDNLDFGVAFDFDGNRMIVGAPTGYGRVVSYVRSGESWSYEALVPGPAGGGAHASTGAAVDLHGDEALIGTPGWNSAGAVGVARRTGATWTLVQTLTPSYIPTSGAHFGGELARSGDRVLIGVPDDNPLGDWSGSVYVFEKDAAGVWQERVKLVRPGGGALDHFGHVLALDGDTAIVGAPGANGNFGSVCVFVRNDAGTPGDPTDDTWPLQTEFLGGSQYELGSAVALRGDRLVIGAPGDNGLASFAGAVRVYERTAGTWTLQSTLSASDGLPDDGFGAVVELDGDLLLVTASGADDMGAQSGKVYLFRYDGSVWHELRSFIDEPDGQGYEAFGSDLAIDGEERVLMSAPFDQGPFANGDGAIVVVRHASDFPVICPGDGSGGTCPCLNWGSAGQGCSSSTSQPRGSRLRAYGSTSVAAGELAFVAENLWSNNAALLFCGTSLLNGGLGVPLGDGLRCIAAPPRRLGLSVPDAFGLARWGPTFANGVPWLAGQTWRFQVWYRTSPVAASPCGLHSNVSSGLEVSFVP